MFETFPRVEAQSGPKWEAIDAAGRVLNEFRAELMIRTDLGLTKTYNRVHSPDEQHPDIVRLRELHVVLDHAVRDAYGWTDLALDHHHWETPQGMRFTVSPAAKDELLDRLLELNHERYAAEVAAGLHAKKAKKAPARRSAKGGGGQESLLCARREGAPPKCHTPLVASERGRSLRRGQVHRVACLRGRPAPK
ncbi:MAG: hypothetical protein ACRD1K_13425 [Acidimicrobiales bacterium]